MKKILMDCRHRLEYGLIAPLFWLVRHTPLFFGRWFSALVGRVLFVIPGYRKIILANIRTALPELSPAETRRIGQDSTFHMLFCMMEFIWIDGRPERIRRRYVLPPEIEENLRRIKTSGERIIFVNPHLGSWEASGVMAPYYANIDMVAIAKPVRNPYLNRLLNGEGREKTAGLRIIFSQGALRESIRALREGLSVGTLIDQNTRVRDGGEFISFFGLPAPSSLAPATLLGYCRQHGIPARIVYGTCVRRADGRVVAHMDELSKPYDAYSDDQAIIQELMEMSERYIRRFPEQYLWMYKRFQYIPPDCPEETRKRYPFYAAEPGAKFFRKIRTHK